MRGGVAADCVPLPTYHPSTPTSTTPMMMMRDDDSFGCVGDWSMDWSVDAGDISASIGAGVDGMMPEEISEARVGEYLADFFVEYWPQVQSIAQCVYINIVVIAWLVRSRA